MPVCCGPLYSIQPSHLSGRSGELGKLTLRAEIDRLHSIKLRLAWEMCCRYRPPYSFPFKKLPLKVLISSSNGIFYLVFLSGNWNYRWCAGSYHLCCLFGLACLVVCLFGAKAEEQIARRVHPYHVGEGEVRTICGALLELFDVSDWEFLEVAIL